MCSSVTFTDIVLVIFTLGAVLAYVGFLLQLQARGIYLRAVHQIREGKPVTKEAFMAASLLREE